MNGLDSAGSGDRKIRSPTFFERTGDVRFEIRDLLYRFAFSAQISTMTPTRIL